MSVLQRKNQMGRPRLLDLAVDHLDKGTAILEETRAIGETLKRLSAALSHFDQAALHAHRAADARKIYGITQHMKAEIR